MVHEASEIHNLRKVITTILFVVKNSPKYYLYFWGIMWLHRYDEDTSIFHKILKVW